MSNQQRCVTPLQSVVAGTVAGGLESLITYPTEYLKTRQQLPGSVSANTLSPLRILTTTVRSHGVNALYTGAGAFCISNASKSGVRFLTFDLVRKHLPSDKTTGKPTAFANMAAGVAAGIAESLTVVTPGENLKTKIVDDRAKLHRYKSSTHALRTIISTEGLSGLYRGVLPVTVKQTSNAFVRFTSYSAIVDNIGPVMDRNGLGMITPATAGASAGVITVYATMPFDNVKTRMQALNGKSLYRGTWHCFATIMSQSGVLAFWKGTTPRLLRLSVSGALSFSVYSKVVELMDQRPGTGFRARALL